MTTWVAGEAPSRKDTCPYLSHCLVPEPTCMCRPPPQVKDTSCFLPQKKSMLRTLKTGVSAVEVNLHLRMVYL